MVAKVHSSVIRTLARDHRVSHSPEGNAPEATPTGNSWAVINDKIHEVTVQFFMPVCL